MPGQEEQSSVIIIGAGAAGLMCAITAAAGGRKVLVLEHSEGVGEKIRISGGGRCNFTNTGTTPQNFISDNPHFVRSALARYTPDDFIALLRKHEIPFHEKKLGQLFCDHSSSDIISMLLAECRNNGVRIECGVDVQSVTKCDAGFELQSRHSTYSCEQLVIATGGLSIAKIGASDFAFRIARQFGLRIIPPRPALVPLTLSSDVLRLLKPLAGVSLDAVVRCGETEFRENILFTHRGLSGPAILQISSYWKEGDEISINILPGIDVSSLLADEHRSKTELKNVLARYLPKRFCDAWCELYAPSKPMNQYNHKDLERLCTSIQDWRLGPNGTEGFDKAEVTVGGIDTRELSSKTMECNNHPGLTFIGECVDVTGWLGGYNFQWAWACGHAAGMALQKSQPEIRSVQAG